MKTDSKCIGISYGHVPGLQDWCFICHEDSLFFDFMFGFDFYRKPGIIFLLAIYVSNT